jgi:hypothetical protein
LRLHGLIQRLPHSNTYQLTSEGIRVAVFYTKLQNRLLRPLLDPNQPPAPFQIRRALTTLEHAASQYLENAHFAPPHKTRHNLTTFPDQVELARVSGHEQLGELAAARVARALRGRRRRRGWRPGSAWRRSAPTGAIVASSARPQEAMRNGASPHETGDQPGFYRFLDLAGIG